MGTDLSAVQGPMPMGDQEGPLFLFSSIGLAFMQ